MGENTSRQNVYHLLDRLTDTKSWAELAKELEKCIAEAGDADGSEDSATIEMADFSNERDDQQTE